MLVWVRIYVEGKFEFFFFQEVSFWIVGEDFCGVVVLRERKIDRIVIVLVNIVFDVWY